MNLKHVTYLYETDAQHKQQHETINHLWSEMLKQRNTYLFRNVGNKQIRYPRKALLKLSVHSEKGHALKDFCRALLLGSIIH